MTFDVAGKVALVTGSNRGIGKAIAESLLAHGVSKIYLAVRNPESVAEIQKTHGDKVVALSVDYTDPASIVSLAEQAQDVNLVVSNAGVLEIANPLDEHFEASLNKELEVNLFGLIRMAKAFMPVLEKNGGGAFVQLNSLASMKNFFGFTSYCVSKAATYTVTQGLKDSVANKGIHVLSVHPGPIDTDMVKKAGFEESDSPSVVAEGIVSSLKAGDFHLFPDAMAKQFEGAYKSYAEAIIEAPME